MKQGGFTKEIVEAAARLYSLQYPMTYLLVREGKYDPGYYLFCYPEWWELKKFKEEWEKREILSVWKNGEAQEWTGFPTT